MTTAQEEQVIVKRSRQKTMSNGKNEMQLLLDDAESSWDTITHGAVGYYKSSNSTQDDCLGAITKHNDVDLVEYQHGTEQRYIQKFMQELSNERESLKETWKQEFEEEHRHRNSSLRRTVGVAWKEKMSFLDPLYRFLSFMEVFLSNMPLTIGAVGLSWVTQGNT
jgi:hypothetical protein